MTSIIVLIMLIMILWDISALDIQTRCIPDIYTKPLIISGLCFNVILHFSSGLLAILGAVIGYLLFYGIYRTGKIISHKTVLGLGDAKLLAAIAAWLGLLALPYVLIISAVSGLLFITVTHFRYSTPKTTSPSRSILFAPFLSLGAVVVMLMPHSLSLYNITCI